MKIYYDEKIEEALCGRECPVKRKCYMQGYERLCECQKIESKSHLKCLTNNARQCGFATHFDAVSFCICPLRIFVVKRLNKPNI